MAAEPRSSGLPEGTRTDRPRASVDPHRDRAARVGRPSSGDAPALRYRCGACEKEFTVEDPGVAPCPRCRAIEEHDALGPAGGDGDGR